MTALRHDRLLLILDADTRALVGQCTGPEIGGVCPRVGAGTVVPCAGRRLVPAYGTGIEGWRLTILDHDVTECPLAWAIEE
jgi:hypothetical protein